jgi:hypothetical protein
MTSACIVSVRPTGIPPRQRPDPLNVLLRSEYGDTSSMMDYIGTAALFIFIVVVLVLLRRHDRRQQ